MAMGFFVDADRERDERKRRLERISRLLACPSCGGDLSVEPDRCACADCGADYAIRDNRVYFSEPQAEGDEFDGVKGRLRRLIGRHYRTMVDIVAPDFPVRRRAEVRRTFDTARQVVIDCGSGSQRLDADMITLDFTDYEAVDIVCDICKRLPFRDGALDGSTSWGVIEHLETPEALIAELARCTKPKGKTVHMVPFLYHFHSSPHDFFRYTHQGLKRLFGVFRVLETRNASGPVSYFMLGFVEFGATTLSFGNERLKAYVYLALCAVTFPVKLLDWPFTNRKSFRGMAPCLVVVAERE